MGVKFINAEKSKKAAEAFHDLAEADAKKSGHPEGSEEYWTIYQNTYGLMSLGGLR